MMNLTTLLSTVLLFNLNVANTVLEKIDTFTTTTTTECTTSIETNPIIIHNATIGIFPGDNNQGKSFIPKELILATAVDIYVTGIKAADDGKQIVVYATTGNIVLLPNNMNSNNGNRIEQSNNMTILQGHAAELTYSGSLGKWVITDHL